MSKPGHNSGKGGPIDPAKLKSYVERIEAVESEEADYKAAKKDIYVEVKAAGLRPKMVRRIVKERKKTEADAEDEAELELYRAALAMPGATYRSVSAKTGIPKSTLQRLVPRNKNGTEPPPQDGEERTTHAMQASDSAPQGSPMPVAPKAGEVASLAGPPVPEGGIGTGTSLAMSLMRPLETADEAPATPSLGAVASPSEGERVATPFLGDDPGDPPPFLRGSRTGRGA